MHNASNENLSTLLDTSKMVSNSKPARSRWKYIALICATVVVGLSMRRYGAAFPPFIASYAPDALWALMVFGIIGFLWTRSTTMQNAIVALAFAYFIEITQLYHPAWLDAIRHTRLGGLVLGFGFLWSDISCYTVGVCIGILLERLVLFRTSKRFYPRGTRSLRL